MTPFEGLTVYLDSDVHSVRVVGGAINPALLIQMQTNLLDVQQRIIEGSDGIVANFIGGCITAYWPSGDLGATLATVVGVAQRIVRDKVQVTGVEYRMVLRFCASELLGAYFGPPPTSRFQVVGKARSRVESLPMGISGRNCVFTDGETFQRLPHTMSLKFAPLSANVYSMNLSE